MNFEYAVVNSKQSGDMASALKKFLKWAIDPKGGNSAQYMVSCALPASAGERRAEERGSN